MGINRMHDDETGSEGRVLILDDEPVIQDVLRDLLEKSGYDVTVLGDASSARKLLSKDGDWDVFLLDFMLPDDDGMEVLKYSRKLHPELAVVMITAFGTVETADFYVAVPSDGDNQELLREVIFEPAPADYTTDQWGQRFAHFHFEGVGPSNRVRAVMKCDVILKDVLYLLSPERAGSIGDIPREVKARYLVDGSKYDLDNAYISKTAQKIVGEEKNVVKAVRKIYDYVTEHIEYEMVGGWNTAATVLKRGTGSCSEYA